MNANVTTLINLDRFPTGRRLFALRRVLEVARERKLPDLRARIEQAMAEDRQTRQFELRWAARSGATQHGPQAPELDHKLDRSLSALASVLAAQTESFDPDSEVAKKAAWIQEEIFPLGVSAVTRLTYVEEHETVNALLSRLHGQGDLVQAVGELSLTAFVERIAELNTRYRAELNVADPSAPTLEQLRSRQAQGQSALLRVVAWILSRYLGDSPEEVEARDHLLGPILRQQQSIRDRRRGRRRPADVDPETGDEIEEPGAGGEEVADQPGEPFGEPTVVV